MRILVTGAGGFLGRHIVEEAQQRGHRVQAMVRPAADVSRWGWSADSGIEIVRHDLRSARGLADKLSEVDTVIHAAAIKSGDFYAQFAGTVLSTENLLRAMREAGVRHIVAVSSFAVYDYLHKRSWSVLDETTPLEAKPSLRYPYCETKLMQERLVREAAEADGWKWTILRPGAVYGPDHLWTDRIGFRSSRIWWRLGGRARVPLTYVEHCADAILQTVEREAANGRIYNIVDDEPPRQREYMSELRRQLAPDIRVVPVPWPLLRFSARGIWVINKALFRGQAKVPNLLRPANLHAVYKPLRYDNDRLKADLGWQRRYPLREAIRRSIAAGEAQQAPGGGAG